MIDCEPRTTYGTQKEINHPSPTQKNIQTTGKIGSDDYKSRAADFPLALDASIPQPNPEKYTN